MNFFRKINGVFSLPTLLVVLCFLMSQNIYAANVPATAQKTWHYFYCLHPNVADYPYSIHVNNAYRYCGDLYIPFKLMPKLVEDTYSEFDIVWNQAKLRTEIAKHTKNKVIWNEPDLPYEISVLPASASVYVNDVPKKIDGFLYNQIFFVRPEDFSEIIGFQVIFDDKNSNIYIKPELPNGITELPLKREKDSKYDYYSAWINYNARWGDTKRNILSKEGDTLLYITDLSSQKEIHMFEFSKDGKDFEPKKIGYEEELFGGYCNGRKYHYFLFGNMNDKESETHPVFVLKKYDKNFKLLDTLNISSAYTTNPFAYGSVSMVEHPVEELLVIHTARERYITDDGLRHQSQITITVDTQKMKVLNDLGRFQPNHVSHSFHQFAFYENPEKLVLFDHGDAYPRSVVMTVMDKKALESEKEMDILTFPGPTGANQTGTSIGTVIQTKNAYFVATNQIDYSKAGSYTFDSYDIKDKSGKNVTKRDVHVHIIDRKNYGIKSLNITNNKSSDTTYSVPKAIDLKNGNVVLMWEKQVSKSNHKSVKTTEYIVINEQGKILSQITPIPWLFLNGVDPILENGKIIWIAESKDKIFLYQFDIPEKWLK